MAGRLESPARKRIRTAVRILGGIRPLTNSVRWMSLRGHVPWRVWRHLPVPSAFRVAVDRDAAFTYLAAPSDVLARGLFYTGSIEPESLPLFVDLAKDARVILDVGAYTGIYTLAAGAANDECSIIAYEPLPEIADSLRRNVELNGLHGRVRIETVAVSNHCGTSRMFVTDRSMPTSGRLVEAQYRSAPTGKTIPINLRSLDSDIPEGMPVDLVKIDVEGAEDLVLAGMTRILRECRPALLVECLPEAPISSIERTLRAASYTFWHVTSAGLRAEPHIRPDSTRRFRNYLFLPQEAHYPFAVGNDVDG